MNQRLACLVVVTAVLLLAPVSAAAQKVAAPPLAGPRVEMVQPFHVVSPWGRVSEATLQAVGRKDPLVAGILSYVLPGLGSFYAGNSGHGVRHLVIEVPGVVLFAVGAASCDFIFGTGCSNGGALAAGVVVLGVNGIWAIVTAVGDANAHNRGEGRARPGRVVGSLYVDPNIVSLSNSGAPSRVLRPAESVGLRLLRVGF